MRSSEGVGITPLNVEGAPKPTSSVMVKRMLGAPFGGTTRGAHQSFDWAAFCLITPPNFIPGGGTIFEFGKIVARGEPATPLISCCAAAGAAVRRETASISLKARKLRGARINPLSIYDSTVYRDSAARDRFTLLDLGPMRREVVEIKSA